MHLKGLHAISSATHAIPFTAPRGGGPHDLHTELYAHVRAMTLMPFPFLILRNKTGRQFVCIITASYRTKRDPKFPVSLAETSSLVTSTLGPWSVHASPLKHENASWL